MKRGVSISEDVYLAILHVNQVMYLSTGVMTDWQCLKKKGYLFLMAQNLNTLTLGLTVNRHIGHLWFQSLKLHKMFQTADFSDPEARQQLKIW